MSAASAYCATTVAYAAPWNPILNRKMNDGSSTRLVDPASITAMSGVRASRAAWKAPPSTAMRHTAGTPNARARMYPEAGATTSGATPTQFTTNVGNAMMNKEHITPNATAVRVTAMMFAPAPVLSPGRSDPSLRARSSFSSATAMTRVAAVPKPCAATTAMTEEYTAVLGPKLASAVVPSVATQYASMVPSSGSATPVAAHVASCRSVTRDNAKSQPSLRDLASSSASTIAAPSPATMISGSGVVPSPTYAGTRTSEPRGSSRRRRRRGARDELDDIRWCLLSAEAPRDVARAVAIPARAAASKTPVVGVGIARHCTADALAPRAARVAGEPRGRRLRSACLRGRGSFEISRARNSDSSETRSAIATAAIEGMRESRVAIDRPPGFVLVRVASAPSARSSLPDV